MSREEIRLDIYLGHILEAIERIGQMRNVVIHGYFTVDLQVVWNTIHDDLPGLRARTRQLLRR